MNKRRGNNQESNAREFSVGQGCTSQRAQENGCRLPLVSIIYLVKAKPWNLPVISQEQEKGEESLKNILSRMPRVKPGTQVPTKRNKAGKGWERLEELSHQWRNKRCGTLWVSHPQENKHRLYPCKSCLSFGGFQCRAEKSCISSDGQYRGCFLTVEILMGICDSRGIISKST